MTFKLKRRFSVIDVMVGIGVIAIVCFIIKYIHSNYYYQRNALLARINSIDGVSHVQTFGEDEFNSYTVNCLRFQVKTRSDAIIEIGSPVFVSDPELRHLHIRRFGPWEFSKVRYDHPTPSKSDSPWLGSNGSYFGDIDIGQCGDFHDQLPVDLRSINDLVENYELLLAFFTKLVDDEAWHFRIDKDGRRFAFRRVRVPEAH